MFTKAQNQNHKNGKKSTKITIEIIFAHPKNLIAQWLMTFIYQTSKGKINKGKTEKFTKKYENCNVKTITTSKVLNKNIL